MTSIGSVQSAYLTHRGQIRDHNEDFVTVREPKDDKDISKNGWVYIVADGVGGADAGEVASSFAVEAAVKHYMSEADSEFPERLKHSVEMAHNDLCDLIDERKDDRRMGTTMVAAVIAEGQAIMANVGDSRGYHIRDGHIRQITKDHSLVAKLLEEGIVTNEEAEALNIGNIILQSIGSEQQPVVDIFTFSLQENDAILLCSDGLTNHVEDPELAEIISTLSPEDASQKLVDLANERGGYDNITVLIAKLSTPLHSQNGAV
ncbi:MAG: Stp1/IreP family PP2C-type Ser/Thr phosphatase [Chloroflexota bacterium]